MNDERKQTRLVWTSYNDNPNEAPDKDKESKKRKYQSAHAVQQGKRWPASKTIEAKMGNEPNR